MSDVEMLCKTSPWLVLEWGRERENSESWELPGACPALGSCIPCSWSSLTIVRVQASLSRFTDEVAG